jgi:hypothetical protein
MLQILRAEMETQGRFQSGWMQAQLVNGVNCLADIFSQSTLIIFHMQSMVCFRKGLERGNERLQKAQLGGERESGKEAEKSIRSINCSLQLLD